MGALLIPSLISAFTMTLMVTLLYLYLYLKSRDRHLKLWCCAWGIYSMRFILHIGIVLKILSPWMAPVQDTVTLIGAFLCLAGANSMAGRTTGKWWYFGAVLTFVWVVLAQVLQVPFFWAEMPLSLFTGLLFSWSGVTILKYIKVSGSGRAIAGYALILWGIHRADYFLLRPVTWFASWGFLLATLLFLASAIGVLLLYYDRLLGELEKDITGRKRAEEALRESESRIRSISNNFSNGMIYQVVIMPDGSRKFTYLSDSVQKLYGITPEQGMEDSSIIYSRIHEDDIALLIKAEEDAIKTFSTFKTEARIRDANGEIRWSSFVSTPKKLEDGSTCWDGIEFIITERKQAEDELKMRMNELVSWHRVTLGREERIIELKYEVNELLTKMKLEPRYESQAK